jgi:hypothetical protein
MSDESGISRCLVFYAFPHSAIGYTQRASQKVFHYNLEKGKEWKEEKIAEKVKELRGLRPLGYKTTRIELAEKDGIRLKVVKNIPVPHV